MGKAAYDRGSALVSRQIRRAYGLDVAEERPRPAPTPRPPSWGDKTVARLAKYALGYAKYQRARGRKTSKSDLLAVLEIAVHDGSIKGGKASREAAVDVAWSMLNAD